MNELTRYIRRHHIALLALFVALGGTSYAAVSLPNGSVGSDQLQHASVTTLKVAPGAITSKRLANGSVVRKKIDDGAVNSVKVADGSLLAKDFAPGELPKGETGPQGPAGPVGPAEGPAGGALTGTYPDPGIANGAVGPDQIGVIPAVRLIRGNGTTFSVPDAVIATNQEKVLPWSAPTGGPTDRSFDIGGFFNPATAPAGCAGETGSADKCIVFPRTGTYVISAGVRWAANATGRRALRIHSGGGRIAASTNTLAITDSAQQTLLSATTVERFTTGQFAYVSVEQTSGGPLDVAGSLQQVNFAATWVGP